MALYKVVMNIGLAGCQGEEYFEADNQKEADVIARELTVSHAESYGFEQNEEYFGDLDCIGRDWVGDAEDAYYEEEGFLDYFVEKV